jgi:hypothetical protein
LAIGIINYVVCRPLPPLPNLEVSDVVVEKAADRALVWINKLLAVGHDIAIKRDRTVFIQVPITSVCLRSVQMHPHTSLQTVSDV